MIDRNPIKRAVLFATMLGALSVSINGSAAELFNLVTNEVGMHRISYSELKSSGADLTGLRARRIGLSSNGKPVAVLAKGQDRAFGHPAEFGEGGYIEFYADGLDSLYSENQVFTVHYLDRSELRTKRKLIRAERQVVNTTLVQAQTYTHTEVVEENNTYSFVSPSSTDPWHFGSTFSFRPTPTYNFSLENVVGGSAAAQVAVEIYGFIDFDLTDENGVDRNDHHYDVEVNGVLIGDQQFDGDVKTVLEASDVNVVDGVNTIKYNYRPIEGVPFDRIALNEISVRYPRTTEAKDGYLEGWFDAQQALVSNIGSAKARVYRKRGDEITRIVGTKRSSAGTIFSTGSTPGHFIVVDPNADGDAGFKDPQVAPIAVQQDISNGQAQYLIIAHPSLMGDELDELVDLRANQYSVKVVDVNQVYAQYGNHNVGSDAIAAYIKHAVANMDTKYVVLIGSDSYDYKNYQFESKSLIPTKYVTTPAGGLNVTQTPADAAYGDVNDDRIPDVATGRISARTKTELGYVVNKIKAYEARVDYAGRILVAADKDDLANGVNFTRDAQDLISAMPANWRNALRDDFRAFPEQDGHQQAHDKLAIAINAGVSLVSYIGHSSQYSWAFTTPPMLAVGEIPGLENQGKPTVVTQWGCWNTYYVDPNGNTMGDAFLTSGEQGAATVLGASTLTTSAGERALGIELNKRIFVNGVTIGDATIAAKQALAEVASYPAIQLGWQILGDPALVVNP